MSQNSSGIWYLVFYPITFIAVVEVDVFGLLMTIRLERKNIFYMMINRM